jgi:hypothetical protein
MWTTGGEMDRRASSQSWFAGRVRRGVLAGVSFLCLLVACSARRGSGAQCPGGYPCGCPQDYLSDWICPHPEDPEDPGRCDCNPACAPVQTPRPQPFTPCGGDPTGTWFTTSIDDPGASITISNMFGYCSGLLEYREGDLRLDLRAKDGDVWVGPLDVNAEFETGQCGTRHEPDSYTDRCSPVEGCHSAPCGRCICRIQRPEQFQTGVWEHNATELYLPTEGRIRYCVTGNKLQMWPLIGPLRTLTRVSPTGRPTECSSRSTTECLAGRGCALGACSGVSACSAVASEAECGGVAGCTWYPGACRGTASAKCALQDYGRVPGCPSPIKP